MLEFAIYMVMSFLLLISMIWFAVFLYVGFDVRKRILGEPYKPGLNLTMKKLKEEYKIADEWWRNR